MRGVHIRVRSLYKLRDEQARVALTWHPSSEVFETHRGGCTTADGWHIVIRRTSRLCNSIVMVLCCMSIDSVLQFIRPRIGGANAQGQSCVKEFGVLSKGSGPPRGLR